MNADDLLTNLMESLDTASVALADAISELDGQAARGVTAAADLAKKLRSFLGYRVDTSPVGYIGNVPVQALRLSDRSVEFAALDSVRSAIEEHCGRLAKQQERDTERHQAEGGV